MPTFPATLIFNATSLGFILLKQSEPSLYSPTSGSIARREKASKMRVLMAHNYSAVALLSCK